jgi:hypothetical protein
MLRSSSRCLCPRGLARLKRQLWRPLMLSWSRGVKVQL